MSIDIKTYFIENIWTLYKTYLRSKKSNSIAFKKHLNCAINVSLRLYHLREHLPNQYSKNRQYYIDICNDFKLLGNVVNVSKHSHLNHGKPLISHSENILEQVTFTQYEDKEGIYQHIGITVYIKLDDGTTRDLHDIIVNVLNMWIFEFNALNVLTNFPFQKTKSNRIPKRNDKVADLNFKSMQNLNSGPLMLKYQKYNSKTKKMEPLDSLDITINMYKPMHEVTMTISDGSNQEEISVEIDDSQMKTLEKLKTDKEKFHYIIQRSKEQQ